MKVELDRKGLESLIRGLSPDYDKFEHPLLIKAGFSYSDQYGRVSWDKISKMTDEELYQIYLICND